MAKETTGHFCWVELATPDFGKSYHFYHKILGWGQEKHAMSEELPPYYKFTAQGVDLGGAYELNAETAKQGIPPHWGAYIGVLDADAIVEKAKKLGAKVLQSPFDIEGSGRMAILQDPTGAVFSLWQSFKPFEKMDCYQHGHVGWNELLTHDIDKAQKFYTQLFGWQAEKQDDGPLPYTTYMNHQEPAAGMMQIQKEWGDDIPAHWGVYFSVDDIEKAVCMAKEEGAEPCCDIIDIPEVGRVISIKDPQGIYFSLIQYNSKKKC